MCGYATGILGVCAGMRQDFAIGNGIYVHTVLINTVETAES